MDSTTPHPAPAEPAPLTVEEGRLDATLTEGGTPLSEQLLLASGLDRLVAEFAERLDNAASIEEAAAAARDEGQRLWATAVARAQGQDEGETASGSQAGSLDRFDDRPLYWARTAMSAKVRTFSSPH
ncbi:MAG: hypothetical protein QOH59_1062, partial [Gemmatimonadales bacterium]|nr:hypothetical protein [Gemmatimonadales bacterium]